MRHKDPLWEGMPILCSWIPSHTVRTNIAAKIAGVPERTLRHAAQKNIIAATKVGKRQWYFRIDDLLKFRARHALNHGGDAKIPLQMLQHLQGKLSGGLSPLHTGAS
jgi:hypothetical protein